MSNRLQSLLKFGAIFILLGVFAFYGYKRSQNYLNGPEIIIDSPKDYEIFSTPSIEISGSIKNIAILYMNDRQIYTDAQGKFNEQYMLAKGNNIIKINGKDQYKRETSVKREVVLK